MLGSVIKKLKNLTVFFKNRKRFIFERLSQDNFSKNLLGFMFRNSKWFNYLKVNINKLPIQKVKKTLSNVFLFIFLFLTVVTLLENTTYTSLLHYLLQIKYLFAVLWTTLQVLPLSIFNTIIRLKDRVNEYWVFYSQKYSRTRTVGTQVCESDFSDLIDSVKSLKSDPFSPTPDSNSSEELNPNITPDRLDYQIKRIVEVLVILKRMYQVVETLSKFAHGDSVRSLKILTQRDYPGSYLVSVSNADLKIIEMMLNIKRLELGMESDMKYKWELRNVTDVMLDSRYLPIQMCIEAGLEDIVINILTSSEYEEINSTSDTSESNSVSKVIEDSMNSTKTQRVLSKNTILHNQSIKSMNWVTSTKKLLTDFANAFDATRNNIWVANNLTQNSNMINFVQNIKNIYGDYNTSGKKQSEQEVLRNYSHNNLSPNIDFIKHYEESFFWIVKQMSYLGSLDAELYRLNVQLNKVVAELDADVLMYIYLISKLNNIQMFLKDESLLDCVGDEFKQLARDTFYQSANKELFTKDMLASMNEIINGKSSADSRPYFYKLSTYDLLYDTESFPEVQDFATDWEETKKFIKEQPSPCPHAYDIVEREYVKDCYRLFVLITRLIEFNNKNKKS